MGRGGEIGQSADEPAGFDAVEAGHLPIDEYDVVGLIAVGGLAYEFDPFLAGGSFVDVKSHAEEHAEEDFACLGVVVDDEGATATEVRVSGATGYRVTLAEEGGKPEGAAVADLAADAHIATHKLSEFSGDGQAEPRAAMLTSRGGVGLFERLEQAAHLLFGKTDPGIGDREVDDLAVVGFLPDSSSHDDLTLFGELDSVVAEIDKDLTEAKRITFRMSADCGINIKDQFEALGGSFFGDEVADILEDFLQIEVDVFDSKLARFDLGEVQNVIDDAEEMLARLLNFANIAFLARVEVGLEG